MDGLPVQGSAIFDLGNDKKSDSIEFVVPEDKVWVVEFVSAKIDLPPVSVPVFKLE